MWRRLETTWTSAETELEKVEGLKGCEKVGIEKCAVERKEMLVSVEQD